MTNNELSQLKKLLTKLQIEESPCKGGSCVGYQNCDFGEDCNYGGECAIDDVIKGIDLLKLK